MKWWVVALRLTGMGWYVAVCIVGGTLGGLWLDQMLGTTMVLTLVGVLLGTVVAFYGLYRMVQPFLGSMDDDQAPKER
jgi:hypothetical protein